MFKDKSSMMMTLLKGRTLIVLVLLLIFFRTSIRRDHPRIAVSSGHCLKPSAIDRDEFLLQRCRGSFITVNGGLQCRY